LQGDPVAEHREASKYAESLYLIPLPRLADVTITSAFPMEYGVQATKALTMASFLHSNRRSDHLGRHPKRRPVPSCPWSRKWPALKVQPIFTERLREGEVPEHLRAFGISYIMQVVYFKEYAERFQGLHVTEGLSPEQVKMMKYQHASTVQEAVDRLAREMPEGGCGGSSFRGNVIAEVR
jgi:hypothetical protein